MKCKKCGRQFNGHFCPSCGTPAVRGGPGRGYKIAGAVLLGYGVIALPTVALPAFDTAASTGLVSMAACIGCIIAGVALLQKKTVQAPPFEDNPPQAIETPTARPAPSAKAAAVFKPSSVPPGAEKKPEPQSALEALKKVSTFRVAGVSYRQDDILELADENSDFSMTRREIIDAGMENERIYQYEFDPHRVELIPEPSNPYDPNAIKVVIDNVHVGYIKKGSTTRVRNLLNAGGKVTAEIKGGPYKILLYRNEDGKDSYEMEHEEIPFSVAVHIEK